MAENPKYVLFLETVSNDAVALVGGKNASLGEMLQELDGTGVKVPPGFATTADAYRQFLKVNELAAPISDCLDQLSANRTSLPEAGAAIRKLLLSGDWPKEIAAAIREGYKELCRRAGVDDLPVAVRSSATAEDLPGASFAGQQETFLNVCGAEALLEACRHCYASLFTNRAIAYRNVQGFSHMDVALSIGVQQMVRADTGGSGVMFSIDTETGFNRVVLINAAWGLGENVVQGIVNPDEYQVFKPFLAKPGLVPILEKRLGAKEKKMINAGKPGGETRNVPTSKAERSRFVLTDRDILELARYAVLIESHYGCPMDMEWAKDGKTGALFIVQARPETVQSHRETGALRNYSISRKGKQLLTGLSVGNAAVAGRVCLIENTRDIGQFIDGAILVASTTDPDWVPVMKRAKAIVTDSGGRTSHAAIVSRELGLPAVTGCGNATQVLQEGQEVTVSCAEGADGFVYEGLAQIEVKEISFAAIPQTRTQVMLNLANPAAAYRWWRLPADGVGLARMEFVVNSAIGVHPMALVHFDEVKDADTRNRINALTAGYDDRTQFFVDRLSRGLSRIAAFGYPKPVIIRMSDFKTNEYAGLLGGQGFEPQEENPMIGFRGASRYYSDLYRDGFALECRAIRHLREVMGFDNVIVMIPFCRTPAEADKVLDVMAENGLERGKRGLQVYVMCEIPSNVIEAEAFAERFDGFSIGSNDLTQLTLGIDRDSAELAPLFQESSASVLWMIETLASKARKSGTKTGFCGQAPSNNPEFARKLVEFGINSISVTPDSFLRVKEIVAEAEAGLCDS
jgi:pyruvate,water dikinase